ncbi:MAG TPA: dihydrofolate reductase family protein [Actinomycetota bacterium]|nr:dihydrofolate reductase family protein [Actinomycetota bacterium]
MDPLERLYEASGLPEEDLPQDLERLYGGPIGFARPRLIANFVSSVDGIVDLSSVRNAPSFVSGKSEQDRFVMGLLRSMASCVLIGAGTLRAEPEHRWTPAHISPEAADAFATLRESLSLPAEPELAVVTAKGDLNPDAEALGDAVVLTTAAGAKELDRRGVRTRKAITLGDARLEPREVVGALRARGHDLILSEAGPGLMAQLLEDRLLDELFLTVSPLVLGRDDQDERRGFADGVDLITGGPPSAELTTVRRGGSHLFLRYTFADR